MTDALTGLPTHRDGLGDAIIARGPACCLVDVDALIWVNAESGHAEGDRVLTVLARFLERAVADRGTTVFRVGGDEFLLLEPSLEAPAARELASNVVSGVRALAIPYRRRDRPSRTTVEVNAVVLRATREFAEGAFTELGMTPAGRDWVGEQLFREKTLLGHEAGIVLDLFDATDCPWAG